MWFIFPQIAGLGQSPTARYYAIASAGEAAAYFVHPILGTRLRECTQLVNAIDGKSAEDIFGFVDSLKFRSCMTLFAYVAAGHDEFETALNKYYDAERDFRTMELLRTE